MRKIAVIVCYWGCHHLTFSVLLKKIVCANIPIFLKRPPERIIYYKVALTSKLSLFRYPYINIIWFCFDWFAMSNSCYNPFIYSIYNVSIQKTTIKVKITRQNLRTKRKSYLLVRYNWLLGLDSCHFPLVMLLSPQFVVGFKVTSFKWSFSYHTTTPSPMRQYFITFGSEIKK